jgi:hypothetical protein
MGGFLGRMTGTGGMAAMGMGGMALPVIATVVLGSEIATMLSGQGPLGKELTDQQKAAHRGGMMGAGAYVNKGRDMVSGMLATESDRAAAKTKGGGERIRANVMAQINRLPENMRTAAAKGASDMLQELEAKGDVARGSTQVFLKGAREELANFKTELSNLMRDLAAARASQAQLPPNMGGAPTLGPPSPNPPVREARGGIVMGTQFSMIGERGPEAVIPLTNRARRDQVLREAGLGGGAARGQRSSSPVINISGVTINSGEDMQGFVAQLENAVRRAMTNIPYADAGAMLA